MTVLQNECTYCRPLHRGTTSLVTQAVYENIILEFGCSQVIIRDDETYFYLIYGRIWLSSTDLSSFTLRIINTIIDQFVLARKSPLYRYNLAFLNFCRELQIPKAIHRADTGSKLEEDDKESEKPSNVFGQL